MALADKVITNILDDMSEFVISNTTPVEKNDQIECMRISSGVAKDVNEDSLIVTALIYALIFFVAIEALACVLIVCSYIKRTFFPATEKAAIEDGDESKKNADNTDNE